MKTLVINLLGGSGLGKSTTAALTYGELKLRGCHAELVREFVKEWAWKGKRIGPTDQGVIYGAQLGRENELYEKVDYIVTDSPLILCPVYQRFYSGKAPIEETALHDYQAAEIHHSVEHLNILLERHKNFDPRGRFETKEQAKEVDRAVEAFLLQKNIPFVRVAVPDRERAAVIADLAEAKFKESGISK